MIIKKNITKYFEKYILCIKNKKQKQIGNGEHINKNHKMEGTFRSSEYWEKRYIDGGNSGAGSYGRVAEFKAEILNNFVNENNIQSVIEFGCGEGNQLLFLNYPKYTGYDVSKTAVALCRNKFIDDKSKQFYLLNEYHNEKAELTLSLDVIFHLIENNVFDNYMSLLFSSSERHVIIYSSNKVEYTPAKHVKHRKFTDWIEKNKREWQLIKKIPNRYPGNDKDGNGNSSFCDFYIFEKITIKNSTWLQWFLKILKKALTKVAILGT
ncbi:MAG: class I SAM-dependent methyltransferase [Endomicrobium sp.]|nr:class I SAM-dependent methyltransferase [Endomicrobium sp.]